MPGAGDGGQGLAWFRYRREIARAAAPCGAWHDYGSVRRAALRYTGVQGQYSAAFQRCGAPADELCDVVMTSVISAPFGCNGVAARCDFSSDGTGVITTGLRSPNPLVRKGLS